jgi:uncharacterized protein YfaS (alpha-2-macroglobulin family)
MQHRHPTPPSTERRGAAASDTNPAPRRAVGPLARLRRALLLAAALAAAGSSAMVEPAGAQPQAAGASAARLLSSSPSGTAADVQQVALRFATDMTRLGDSQAAAPAELVCNRAIEPGEARWVDPRSWVLDWRRPLPVGLHCQIRLRPGLRDLAGVPLAAADPASLAFSTGGPQVMQTWPHEGSEVREDQAFLIQMSAPVADLAAQVQCETRDGGPTRAAVPLGAGATQALLRQVYGDAPPPAAERARWTALRCQGALPAGVELRLRVAGGVASQGVPAGSDRLLAFRVRPAFAARLDCQRSEPGGRTDAPCDPRGGLKLVFNAPLRGQGEGVLLRLPSGRTLAPRPQRHWVAPHLLPEGLAARGSEPQGYVHALAFEPLDVDGLTATLQLPADLRDLDGRPLANAAQFPLLVPIAELGAYLGFTHQHGSLALPGAAPARWPLALRRLGSEPARIERSTLGPQADAEQADRAALALWRAFERLDAQGTDGAARLLESLARQPLLRHQRDIELAPYDGRTPMLAAVELAEPGLQLLRARHAAAERTRDERAARGGTAVPRRDWSLVQVTRLNPQLRIGLGAEGASLVFVSALADARPLAGVQLALYDCDDRRVWQARSDAQGLATIAAGIIAPLLRCADPAVGRGMLVARSADGGDRALLPVRAERDDLGPLPFSHPGGAPSAASDLIAHLLLDRSLFTAGETVHVQAWLRRATARGFEPPPRPAAALHLELRHESGEVLARSALDMAAEGGQAQAQIALPAGAKLGRYRLLLRQGALPAAGEAAAAPAGLLQRRAAPSSAGGPALAEASLQIEEFRRPAFEARLDAASRWSPPATGGSAAQQRVDLALALSYLSGGAAGGAPVELRARYDARPRSPVAGYWFGERSALLGTARPLPPAPAAQRLLLDARGRLDTSLPLPALDAPLGMVVEMQFTDPNGEVQTRSADLGLWPAAVKIGLAQRMLSGGQLRIDLLALDTADQPRAALPVRVSAQPGTIEGRRNGRSEFRPSGDEQPLDCHAPGATPGTASATDAQGRLLCRFAPPRPRADAPPVTWLVSARTQDAYGRAVVSELFVSPWTWRWPGMLDDRLERAEPGVDEDAAVAPGSRVAFRPRPARLPATVVLTVEREGVLAAQVHRLERAEQTLAFDTVAAAWAPNVQVRAQYLYPDDTRGALSGSQSTMLRIEPRAYQLDLRLQPARAEARPRERVLVDLQVTLPDGSPAAGAQLTLAAVDDALLQLKPNDSWRLVQSLLRERAATVAGTLFAQRLARGLVYGPQPLYWPQDEGGPGLPRGDGDGPVRPLLAAQAAPAAAAARSNESPALAESADAAAQQKAGGDAVSPALRRDLRSLVLWRTDLRTDAQGRARLELPLTDLLGRVRIAAFASHGADRFGQGEATLTVRQPLELTAQLPQVLRSGDRIEQGVLLRNSGASPLRIAFDASARVVGSAGEGGQGAATAPADELRARGLRHSQTLQLEAGQAERVAWTTTAPEGATALVWTLRAQVEGEPGGGDALEAEQRLVAALEPSTRAAMLLQLPAPLAVGSPGAAVELPLARPPGALAGSTRVQVELRASLVDAALAPLQAWMRQYPFTCLEQQTSRALVLDDRAAWQRITAELPKYLDAQGLARYFPQPQLAGSETLTVYLLDAARAAGWELPATERERMLDALAALVAGRLPEQDWAPERFMLERQLAAQAALTEHGRLQAAVVTPPDIGRLSAATLTAWLRTLAALPASAEHERRIAEAGALLRSRYELQGRLLRWRDEAREASWWFMGSGDLSAARAAHLALALAARGGAQAEPWQAESARLILGLAGRQREGRMATTIANAWTALALRRFAARAESAAVRGSTSAELRYEQPGSAYAAIGAPYAWAAGAAPASSPASSPAPSAQPAAALAFDHAWSAAQSADGAMLRLRHEGSGAPWAAVSLVAAVPVTQPLAQGLRIARSVSPVQQRVPGRWSVGDVLRVTLTLESNAPQTWVALRDGVPSGATHIGRGLAGESTLARQNEGPRGAWTQPSFDERAADEYRAYFRWVPQGRWSIDYTLRLNHPGRFQLPAARVEAMYAPEVFGEAPQGVIVVQP